MIDIPSYTSEDLEQWIRTYDIEHNIDPFAALDKESIRAEIGASTAIRTTEGSVLGIDIYKYSKYPIETQNLIPFLFSLFRDITNQNIARHDFVAFQNHDKALQRVSIPFVDTGDGGFSIMATPLHCVLYAIWFEIMIRSYNSYHYYRKLRALIGEITLRYTITTGQIFQLNGNYYGPSIINNARILSTDKLNRCLMDNDSYEWFLRHLNGIENLARITDADLAHMPIFSDYKFDRLYEINSSVLRKAGTHGVQNYGIQGVNIQRVGTISVKGDTATIHNLHMHFLYSLNDEERTKSTNVTMSLGNLNASGIEVD